MLVSCRLGLLWAAWAAGFADVGLEGPMLGVGVGGFGVAVVFSNVVGGKAVAVVEVSFAFGDDANEADFVEGGGAAVGSLGTGFAA